MGDENVAYAYNGVLFSHKKEWITPTAWIDLENITLSEKKLVTKDCELCDLIYMKCSE